MSYNPHNPREQMPCYGQLRGAYSRNIPVRFTPEGDSRAKQSFKEECDINRIMARYEATGELPDMGEVAPQYLDVTGQDFQEHQNFIAGANTLFFELPSGLRARFENNPGLFLDFCSQEKNRPEMAELGLLRASPAPAPAPIPPAPGPAPEAPAPAPDFQLEKST